MKFIANHMKESFYSFYLRLLPKKRITSKDLGFTTENRVFISENLTQQNQELFIMALNLKREKKLATAYTVNGIVNIKFLKGASPHEIRHKHDFDILLKSTATPADSASQTSAETTTRAIVNHIVGSTPVNVNTNTITPSTSTIIPQHITDETMEI